MEKYCMIKLTINGQKIAAGRRYVYSRCVALPMGSRFPLFAMTPI